MNPKLSFWLHGLYGAIVTGIGNGISLAVADATFSIFKDGTGLLQATAATTLISIGAYLKQSPLPFYDFEGGSNLPPTGVINIGRDAVKKASVIAIFLMAAMMVSCVSPDTGKVDVALTVERSKPFIHPSATAIGVGAIIVAKDPEAKTARAKWLNSIASEVRLLTSESPPTSDELKVALMRITPQASNDLAQAVVSITSLYSSVRAGFGKDTKAIIEALDQIALGLQDAAAPYLLKSTSGDTPKPASRPSSSETMLAGL
jgi:hypothetical protein